MDEPLSVSVVIRCRNEEAHIGRLLTGILRQTKRADQIVLVDSGSTDATVSIASAFPVQVVDIAPDDFSFGAACNRGCDVAVADTVVFVSAHCFPIYDTWLEKLVQPFRNEAVALTYGRQIGPEDARYSERRLLASWFPATSIRRQRHPFCNNANAAVRRSIWQAGLRYDEHLTGLEDLDWAKRAIDSGHLLSYVADAGVVHVHNETFSQIVSRYRREAIAHRQIYDEQAMSLGAAARLAGVNILNDLLAARREHQLVESALDITSFRLAQFWGTYRGFSQSGPVTELLMKRFFYPDNVSVGDIPADIPAPGQLIDYDEPLSHGELAP